MVNALALVIALFAQLQPLPPTLVPLDSDEGRRLLIESGANRDFFPLASHFATQPSTSFCGVTSAVMILNAMPIAAPPVPELAPFRAFTEANIFDAEGASGLTAARVSGGGLTMDQLAHLLRVNHAAVEESFADASSLEAFRAQAAAALASGERFVLVDFLRAELGQDMGAHWSPLAAYHAASDRFLVLDVARFRYPPYWATAADLYRAMKTGDLDSGKSRGWLLAARAPDAPAPVHIPPMAHRLFYYAAGAGGVVFLVGAGVGALLTYLRMRRRLAR
jgi:hypothetical protein